MAITTDTAEGRDASIEDVICLIESGYYAWNRKAVEDALAELHSAARRDLDIYVEPLGEYRLALFSARDNADDFRKHVKRGISAAKTCIRMEGERSDSFAMLALLTDLRSTFSRPAKVYERKALSFISKSMMSSPDNPRSYLAEGIFYFRRTGRNPDFALRAHSSLSKACSLFEKESGVYGSSPNWQSWGHEESLVWLALSMNAGGDRAGSLAKLREALALRPGFVWAQYEMSRIMTG